MRFLLALILGFFLTSPLLAEEATYHLAGTTLRNLKLTPNPPEVGELAVSFSGQGGREILAETVVFPQETIFC